MGIEKITENVYANVDYFGGNVSCINTTEGLVLVDTPTQNKEITHWKEFILGLNPKGIRYIINTHIHFDHIMGNRLLGGTVITHEKTRERLFEKGATLREMAKQMPGIAEGEVDFILSERLIPAEITLCDSMTLYVGDSTLELRHIGGHTPDSILVYAVEDQVLVTGDNLTSNHHPYKGDARFSDWNKALQVMKGYETKAIVPGHGDICKGDAVDTMIKYFKALQDMTGDLMSRGQPLEAVVRTVHEKMFSFFEVEPEMLEGARMMFDMGTERLYRELMEGK